ncbi:MAG TPA: hypothetical protein VNU64_05220 [Burkholderiales bacterium]|nr:hypothetical protein [Burkholderiales bacterium]
MDQRPAAAALASHLVGAAIGALAGAAAGIAAAFFFAPHSGRYLSAVNAPICAGLGLMAGLLSPEWSRGLRVRLPLLLAALLAASGCESVPAMHFINGQLIAEHHE